MKKKRAPTKKNKLLIACATISVLVICYLILTVGVIMYFNAPNSYHKEDKRFFVERGMTLREVVNKLHREQIIKSPTTFLYVGQMIKGVDPKVRYGEYFFEENISYYKILHKMIHGNIFFRKLTIAEGLSVHSALTIIDRAPGLIGKVPENVKEGTLLPETYFYSYNDTKSGLIKRMKESMTRNLDILWEERDKSIPVKTKEQAVILASIVERETSLEVERGKVASVFVNRLRKGMKLQSDPTIIYSFTFGDTSLEHPIRMSDIRNKSPYNTYHISGLPPAPISNPGIASLKAVLNPLDTEYIFFVASGYGDHVFTSTLKDHNESVAKYRKLTKERKDKKADAKKSKKSKK